MQESVHFTRKQSFVRTLQSGVFTTTVAAISLSTFFAIFSASMILAGEVLPGQALKSLLLLFFPVSWCFGALASFPICAVQCWRGQSRKVWVDENTLHFQATVRGTLELNDANWTKLRLARDDWGFYFGKRRPRLRVSDGDRVIGLGFTDTSADRWVEFFEARNVRRAPQTNWLPYLATAIGSAVVFATIGVLIERALARFGGFVPGAVPRGSLIFISVLDGMFVGMIVFAVCEPRPNLHPIKFLGMNAAVFACIGLQWSNHYGVALINGVFGAILPVCVKSLVRRMTNGRALSQEENATDEAGNDSDDSRE